MTEKYCIYCDEDLPLDRFSDEHIWPQALGGDSLTDFWRLDVCSKCNSISGLFVDGAFVRNFFVKTELLNKPYNYFGQVREHTLGENRVIDIYLGDLFHLCHVRAKETDTVWHTQVGGNPISKGKKSYYSHIYISVHPENLQTEEARLKLKDSLKLVLKAFGRASFFINLEVGNEPRLQTFDLNDDDQKDNLNFLESIGHKPSLSIQIQADFDRRFLSKICLAIGYNLLGESYLEKDYTKLLRQHFREGNHEKRLSIPVKQTGYFEKLNIEKLFENSHGKWLLTVLNFDPLLLVLIKTPQGKMMTSVIAEYEGVSNDLSAEFNSVLTTPVWLIENEVCEELTMSAEILKYIHATNGGLG